MVGCCERESTVLSRVAQGLGMMMGGGGNSFGGDRESSRTSGRWGVAGSGRRDTYDMSSLSDDGQHTAMASNSRGASGITTKHTTEKVTIVERLEVDHAPHVSECGGVRLSVPPNSLRCGIGPITVEQTAEEVNGNYGAVREYGHDFAFFVMLAVHCLPAPCSFDAPLTLDFVVEDQRIRWWHRRAAREDALREYKICSRQSEHDPWREMHPKDVSVVWNERGHTCLRARIDHFTWFGWAKRTTKTSTHMISPQRGESVLVFNSTNSVAHITSLPVPYKTSKTTVKSYSLTFCETDFDFDTGGNQEQITIPLSTQSEIVPVGGMTELFLEEGAKEMKVIVCFLPDRTKAGLHTVPQAGTATSSEASSCLCTGPWPSAVWPISGAVDLAGGQNLLYEREEMVYSMTKLLPVGQRLTLLGVSLNRRIYIDKKNARALESYAMMLADFDPETE